MVLRPGPLRAVLAAYVLVLAACSSDAEPVFPATSSVAASTSSTVAPTAPTTTRPATLGSTSTQAPVTT